MSLCQCCEAKQSFSEYKSIQNIEDTQQTMITTNHISTSITATQTQIVLTKTQHNKIYTPRQA